MMPYKISYKSYCWVVGTTSFRTDDFNVNIERQLALAEEFRSYPENAGVTWRSNTELQTRYYQFLIEKGFLAGSASLPDKDAREKTSGLVDIGLLDKERNLTEAGKALLKISRSEDFRPDNLLEIPRDSFLYLKQMMKTCNRVDQNVVRPFLVFCYVVSRTGYLTNEEFAYLLPLCVDAQTTEHIISEILDSRKSGPDYENIILHVLMAMPNYQEALRLLQTEPVTAELICAVGMNRKSKQYDKPYYEMYQLLKRIVFEGENLALPFFEMTKKLTNGKIGAAWRKYFFRTLTRSVIMSEGNRVLNEVPILSVSDEWEFQQKFFELMHLFKAKATLIEYFDLNRRYFKATDTVIFEDDRVYLDVLPKCYIDNIADRLPRLAFEATDLLERDVELAEISPDLEINQQELYRRLSHVVGKSVTDVMSARKVIKDERYERLDRLIQEKFSKDRLLELFTCFENRNDEEIRRMVTDNADIPTIFEYILAIAWYVLSGRQGDVLEYMNLSLEADLLPKTHAGGGEADIVWKYPATADYPAHTLLLEATLADGTNQRRMEMEPVSRHLGGYQLGHPDETVYCIFAATYLHCNVISDFRCRKHMIYYSNDGKQFVEGLKIMPIQTREMKVLLQRDLTYGQLYRLLEDAHHREEMPLEWYEENVMRQIAEHR